MPEPENDLAREKGKPRKTNKELAKLGYGSENKNKSLTSRALGEIGKRVKRKLPSSPSINLSVIETLVQNYGIVLKTKKSYKDNRNLEICCRFYVHGDISKVDTSAKSPLISGKNTTLS